MLFVFLKSMKKISALFLVFILLVHTSGFCMVINYCPMKKAYSFSLYTEKASCCCKAKDGKNNCCKSKPVELKKIADHYVSISCHSSAAATGFSPEYQPTAAIIIPVCPADQHTCADFKPPDPPGEALNLLFRVFRI